MILAATKGRCQKRAVPARQGGGATHLIPEPGWSGTGRPIVVRPQHIPRTGADDDVVETVHTTLTQSRNRVPSDSSPESCTWRVRQSHRLVPQSGNSTADASIITLGPVSPARMSPPG